MKIALVIDDTLDTPDGVQQYVLTLGRWLDSQGHEVHYLAGETKRTDIPNLHVLARNRRVRFNGNRLSLPLPASKARIAELLAQEQFDVVHVQAPYSPFLAGRIIKRISAKTVVVGNFNIMPYSHSVIWASRLLAVMNHRTAQRFDAMLANTEPTLKFAHDVFGFRPILVPNPFPMADFHVEPSKSRVPLTVIFLGRLVARKGAMQLLMAVAYLRTHGLASTEFRVIVGGKGPLREDLETYVAQQRLNGMVTFAGFVAEADKAAFLAQGDLAVFPSLSGESFGISLLEAMAAVRGVVLAGDNPGYHAVLGPLSTDQLVDPHDIPAFATVLAHWIDSTPARDMAAAAQKEYVTQFDINVVGSQIVKVYAGALHSRRGVQ
ncbi:MAG TPA: glycosyltransferase family 4 protein [Candidatus Saccharimonadales bacterium]